MQTQVSQQYNEMVRIAGVAMVMSRAAAIAILLTWAPSLIGSAKHNPEPAKLPAVPALAAGAKDAPADPGQGSRDSPTRPICAGLGGIASTQVAERNSESGGTIGCGIGSNLAAGTPASNHSGEQVDVATFLSWHGQARSPSPYAYEATLSRPPQMRADRS